MTVPGFRPAVYQTLSAIRTTTSDVITQVTKAARAKPVQAEKTEVALSDEE